MPRHIGTLEGFPRWTLAQAWPPCSFARLRRSPRRRSEGSWLRAPWSEGGHVMAQGFWLRGWELASGSGLLESGQNGSGCCKHELQSSRAHHASIKHFFGFLDFENSRENLNFKLSTCRCIERWHLFADQSCVQAMRML